MSNTNKRDYLSPVTNLKFRSVSRPKTTASARRKNNTLRERRSQTQRLLTRLTSFQFQMHHSSCQRHRKPKQTCCETVPAAPWDYVNLHIITNTLFVAPLHDHVHPPVGNREDKAFTAWNLLSLITKHSLIVSKHKRSCGVFRFPTTIFVYLYLH